MGVCAGRGCRVVRQKRAFCVWWCLAAAVTQAAQHSSGSACTRLSSMHCVGSLAALSCGNLCHGKTGRASSALSANRQNPSPGLATGLLLCVPACNVQQHATPPRLLLRVSKGDTQQIRSNMHDTAAAGSTRSAEGLLLAAEQPISRCCAAPLLTDKSESPILVQKKMHMNGADVAGAYM